MGRVLAFKVFQLPIFKVLDMHKFSDRDFPEHERGGVTFAEVCRASEITRRKGRKIEFDDDTHVAIFRIHNAGMERLCAVSNICPHQHASVLNEGEITFLDHDENPAHPTITCPLHGYVYSLESGQCLSGGRSHLRSYAVFEENGMVFVEKPAPPESLWKW